MPTRSIIWDYFSKTDIPFDARCNQCHKLISFSGGSTTNLMKHLKRKHLLSVGASKSNAAPISAGIDLVQEAIQRKNERLKRQLASSKSNKKRSIIWNYFSKTDLPFRARCNRCCHIFSYTGNSLNNLMRHLRRKHSIHLMGKQETEQCAAVESISEDVDQNYEESDVLEVPYEIENSTETLGESPAVVKVVPEQQLQQPETYYVMEHIDVGLGKEDDKQVMKLITKELHPFNIIDNKEFIAFVNMLNPNYSLPCHKSLSNEWLPKMYLSAVTEVKSALKGVRSVALTTDTWTSINNEDFISVTAYFLDASLELQSKLLDCISFRKISSINVAVFLKEVAAFWGLSNKIAAVVTEDIPLLTEAVKECQWQHIPCFALAFNRIVKAGLEDINSVITKIRNIVLYLKKPDLALTNFSPLQSEMGLADIKLKTDSSVGWNSTFEMMTAFLKVKDSLIAVSDLLDDSLKLSQHEWTILECAVKLLVPFNSIMKEISGDTVVPLSKVPYMVRFMMRHVTSEQQNFPPEVQKMSCTMKQELTQFKNIESNDVIRQSVLLDPRMKKRGFQESSLKEAYSSLLEKVASLKNEEIEEINKERSSTQCKCGTHRSSNNDRQSEFFLDMWSELRENETTHNLDLRTMGTIEIDSFLTKPYMNMKENPITFWTDKLNQKTFPTLFELVKSRFCIPATSVPCKNIFSKSGNVLAKKRTLLTSGKLREILFLHHNSQ